MSGRAFSWCGGIKKTGGVCLCALGLLLLSGLQVEAADETHSPNPLTGGVRGAAIRTKDGLQKMGESTKSIKRSAEMIAAEVTRKDTVSVRGPNVLPNGVVIPAMPNPSGVIEMGDLPIRPKMLNYMMGQLGYSMQLLQNEVDALIIPEEKAGELKGDWQALRQSMAGVQEHYTNLLQLAQGPKYDKLKIGREALYIHDGIDSVNKIRKRLLATVKG